MTCCVVCVCVKWNKYRKQHGITSIKDFLNNHKDRDIEMGPIATSYSEFRKDQKETSTTDLDDDDDENNTLSKRSTNKPPQRASWTSKDSYSQISLSDQDEHHLLDGADEKGQLADWINNTIPPVFSVIDKKVV